MISYSLVEKAPSGDAFWILPHIHSWLGEHLDPMIRKKKLCDAVQLVGTSVSYIPGVSEHCLFELRVLRQLQVCWQHIQQYLPLPKEAHQIVMNALFWMAKAFFSYLLTREPRLTLHSIQLLSQVTFIVTYLVVSD